MWERTPTEGGGLIIKAIAQTLPEEVQENIQDVILVTGDGPYRIFYTQWPITGEDGEDTLSFWRVAEDADQLDLVMEEILTGRKTEEVSVEKLPKLQLSFGKKVLKPSVPVDSIPSGLIVHREGFMEVIPQPIVSLFRLRDGRLVEVKGDLWTFYFPYMVNCADRACRVSVINQVIFSVDWYSGD